MKKAKIIDFQKILLVCEYHMILLLLTNFQDLNDLTNFLADEKFWNVSEIVISWIPIYS